MTEFSTEQIKDVQIMNVAFTVEALLINIADCVKHVGSDISARLDSGELDEKTVAEYEHWLDQLGHALNSTTKAIQINNIGHKVVNIDKDSLDPDVAKELKDTVSATEPIAEMVAVMKETTEDTLMRVMAEALGMTLTREELAMLSGQ